MIEGLKLRAISYADPSGDGHTAFVAMTDEEFAALQAAPAEQQSLKESRVLYVLPGDTLSETDCAAAGEIFARVYGKQAISKPG